MDFLQQVFSGFPMSAAAFVPALWLAWLLDLLVGDPRSMPHPVVLIARIAAGMESFFGKNKFFGEKKISPTRAGRFTVLSTLLICGIISVVLFIFLSLISPWALFAGSVLLLYATTALRSLADHAMNVYNRLGETLQTGDLKSARESVGRIVGRETKELDEAGVIRACVESVAENMSDGVIAPLFFAVLAAVICSVIGLGRFSVPAAALAAVLYKTVNTMDSMFGYKNEKYLQFGRSAALLDDAVNYIPARLTAFGLVFASFLTGRNGRLAWKILRRDKQQHASPNAGFPEAAMAGALGIQLGGSSRYFGKTEDKPTLGDAIHPPNREQIKDAVRLMILSSILSLLVFSLLYCAVL
ncbi:MAG: adenosylcobinamide-phosphate synthase CbiB [Desulfobulbaceae bacterium]|nr:adenosylcobinamide-phosphate synthase CbiB [Desulfobulbaceae bacterium]